MLLNELRDNDGARKARQRAGRGIGSGKGKTCGSGQKGQKARSGVAINGFEGGQMPIYRRLPKRGFTSLRKKDFQVVNIGRIQKAIDDKKIDHRTFIDIETLVNAGVVGKVRDGVRLLAKGEIKAKINICVTGASLAAVEAVEKAGGSVSIDDGDIKRSELRSARFDRQASLRRESRAFLERRAPSPPNLVREADPQKEQKAAAKIITKLEKALQIGEMPRLSDLEALRKALMSVGQVKAETSRLSDLLLYSIPNLASSAVSVAARCIYELSHQRNLPRNVRPTSWPDIAEHLSLRLGELGARFVSRIRLEPPEQPSHSGKESVQPYEFSIELQNAIAIDPATGALAKLSGVLSKSDKDALRVEVSGPGVKLAGSQVEILEDNPTALARFRATIEYNHSIGGACRIMVFNGSQMLLSKRVNAEKMKTLL